VTFAFDQKYTPKKDPSIANTVFYMRCSRRECPGRAQIRQGHMTLDLKVIHSCIVSDPEDRVAVMDARRALNEMKNRARNTSDGQKVKLAFHSNNFPTCVNLRVAFYLIDYHVNDLQALSNSCSILISLTVTYYDRFLMSVRYFY